MGDWLQDKCNEIQKAQQEHIQKSFGSDIGKSWVNDLIKAKAANIGDIHIWNGKRYKKQPNGKWLEVSESHEMTKKEHSDKGLHSGDESWAHTLRANKLSDKEYSDEEVGLGRKKEDKLEAVYQGSKEKYRGKNI